MSIPAVVAETNPLAFASAKSVQDVPGLGEGDGLELGDALSDGEGEELALGLGEEEAEGLGLELADGDGLEDAELPPPAIGSEAETASIHKV